MALDSLSVSVVQVCAHNAYTCLFIGLYMRTIDTMVCMYKRKHSRKQLRDENELPVP